MKQFSISKNDAEQRLDKFLKKLFPNATRSLLYKLNRKDKIKIVTLNWKKTKQDNEYKLQIWEIVQVYLPEKEFEILTSQVSVQKVLSTENSLLKEDIVYEDGSILVINKSSGCNVHPWENKTTEVSLIQQVEDYYKWSLSSLTFKPSLIHRIDRDTSGIVMVAKQKQALTKLSSDFKKKKWLKKVYFAIVLGKLSRPSATIKKSLLRIENAKNENKVQVSDEWQEAITHYKVIDEYKLMLPEWEKILSTLEIEIETGRMHQIRVHMAHIWTPILWDKSYWDKKINAYFEKKFSIKRHMLHAWKIEFQHPEKNTKIQLSARLKTDMIEFLEKLKQLN